MKKIASLAAVGMLALATALVPSSPSAADGPECDHYNHCYGIAHYPPPNGNIDSVAVELWTDCLHLDTPLSDMATHELWLWTNAASTSWLEGGYIRGIVAGGDSQNFFRWFWAEYTGTTLYTHFIEWAAVSQWKQLWFTHYADDSWGVYLGGQYKGMTAQRATAGTYVQVGGETTEPEVYSHGKSRYLQWHYLGGSAWTGASTGSPAGTAGVYSVSASGGGMEQTSLKKMCTPPAARQGTASAPSTKELKASALAFAAAYGEESPSGLQAVATTRKAAQRVVGAGDKFESDPAAYLVQMRGSFVGRAPKGAQPPRGNTMTLTIDRKTGEVTDMSIGNDRQDLSELGAVKSL
ncbi:hypothetical protein ACGF0J_22080 [Nonomuraea sp. NPDC047897]|uniref:hypothetical protein n=1 Tax=Nonomuraea sp. NPDC047897 TaxID=3364346 RepID=UPI003715D532